MTLTCSKFWEPQGYIEQILIHSCKRQWIHWDTHHKYIVYQKWKSLHWVSVNVETKKKKLVCMKTFSFSANLLQWKKQLSVQSPNAFMPLHQTRIYCAGSKEQSYQYSTRRRGLMVHVASSLSFPSSTQIWLSSTPDIKKPKLSWIEERKFTKREVNSALWRLRDCVLMISIL